MFMRFEQIDGQGNSFEGNKILLNLKNLISVSQAFGPNPESATALWVISNTSFSLNFTNGNYLVLGNYDEFISLLESLQNRFED